MIKKKFFFILVLNIFILNPLFSSDFSFELMPYSGISYGQFNEHIYSSSDSSIQRSLLEWETKPLVFFGLGAKSSYKNISIDFHGNASVPTFCGTLKDSDWNETGKIKYIYSLLDEKVENAYSVSVSLSYNFDIEQVIRVSPVFFAEYSCLKIKSSNGEGWFASSSYSSTGEDEAWNSGYARYYKEGQLYGINYEKKSISCFSGIKIGANFTESFYCELGLFLSPFSRFQVYDTHLNGTSTPYKLNQYATGYFSAYKMSFTSTYKISRKIDLDFSADFTSSDILKSPLYHNYYSSKAEKSNQKAGTDYFTIKVTAGLRIKIL